MICKYSVVGGVLVDASVSQFMYAMFLSNLYARTREEGVCVIWINLVKCIVPRFHLFVDCHKWNK
jgi:hypothetical protein